jgi:hypothetical protein
MVNYREVDWVVAARSVVTMVGLQVEVVVWVMAWVEVTLVQADMVVEGDALYMNMIHWIDKIWQMVVWVENRWNFNNIKYL